MSREEDPSLRETECFQRARKTESSLKFHTQTTVSCSWFGLVAFDPAGCAFSMGICFYIILIFPLTHPGEHLCSMLFVPRSQKCVNTEAVSGVERTGVLNSAAVASRASQQHHS